MYIVNSVYFSLNNQTLFNMTQDTIWKIQTKKPSVNLTLPELFDILLQNRNLTTAKDIEDFLSPNLNGITEMIFEDMQKSILRIEKAIKNKRKNICLFRL